MITVLALFEALILASSLSIDAFVASFAYGSNRIRIPMMSVQIINFTCSSFLGISLFFGSIVKSYLPEWLAVAISFTVLFILGAIKLLDSVIKHIIRRHSNLDKQIKFQMTGFKFITRLYADTADPDLNASKIISPAEAVLLAISLSLDGISVGFGAALRDVNIWTIFFASLITDMLAVVLGSYVGNKAAKKAPFNISWLSGIILIGLAVIKLF